MARSRLSDDLINEGLIKEKEKDKYKRDIGGNKVNVGKGELREPTDKFRRNNRSKKELPGPV